MRNPWLDIPETDYVGHMSSPEVDQYRVLNRLMAEGLATVRPRTVLVLGCSNGNGFEHVDPAVTSRLVAIDINPRYLNQLVERFPNPAFDLVVQCADLQTCRWETATFDLVHAALVFEYVEWPRLLPSIATALRPAGVLSVVLQRPSSETAAVTSTQFTALQSLESIFRFVDPDVFVAEAASHGLETDSRRTEVLETGKAFEVLRFRKNLS